MGWLIIERATGRPKQLRDHDVISDAGGARLVASAEETLRVAFGPRAPLYEAIEYHGPKEILTAPTVEIRDGVVNAGPRRLTQEEQEALARAVMAEKEAIEASARSLDAERRAAVLAAEVEVLRERVATLEGR